jgi:hypothetical protein
MMGDRGGTYRLKIKCYLRLGWLDSRRLNGLDSARSPGSCPPRWLFRDPRESFDILIVCADGHGGTERSVRRPQSLQRRSFWGRRVLRDLLLRSMRVHDAAQHHRQEALREPHRHEALQVSVLCPFIGQEVQSIVARGRCPRSEHTMTANLRVFFFFSDIRSGQILLAALKPCNYWVGADVSVIFILYSVTFVVSHSQTSVWRTEWRIQWQMLITVWSAWPPWTKDATMKKTVELKRHRGIVA